MTRQSETDFATALVTKYGQQCAELFALFLHTIPVSYTHLTLPTKA